MTTQIPEILFFGARKSYFYEEPLAPMLPKQPIGASMSPNRVIYPTITALMRGYCGQWRIRQHRLYLCHLWSEGVLSLDTLFPGNDGEVFAEWFSGTITLPYGGRLSLPGFHRRFLYASYLKIAFQSGIVLRTEIDDALRTPIPETDIPPWLRRAKTNMRQASAEPLSPPTTTGDSMPAQIVEALLANVAPVRAWRVYLGLGVYELAAKAGISKAYLCQIETRKRVGALKTLGAIADALALKVDDLREI